MEGRQGGGGGKARIEVRESKERGGGEERGKKETQLITKREEAQNKKSQCNTQLMGISMTH